MICEKKMNKQTNKQTNKPQILHGMFWLFLYHTRLHDVFIHITVSVYCVTTVVKLDWPNGWYDSDDGGTHSFNFGSLFTTKTL